MPARHAALFGDVPRISILAGELEPAACLAVPELIVLFDRINRLPSLKKKVYLKARGPYALPGRNSIG